MRSAIAGGLGIKLLDILTEKEKDTSPRIYPWKTTKDFIIIPSPWL